MNLDSSWGIAGFWDTSTTGWRQWGCYYWSLESWKTVICEPLRIYISLKYGAVTPASVMLCITTAVTFMLTFLKFCRYWPPKLYLKPYHSFSFSLFLSGVVVGWSHFSPSKMMSKTKTAFEIWETVRTKISPSFLNSPFSQIPSVLCWTWGNPCLSRFWRLSVIPYLVFYNNLPLKCKSITGLKFAFRGHLDPVQIFAVLTALKFTLMDLCEVPLSWPSWRPQ